MNIEYIKNFVKLAEYKSFSKLAKNLPITQSTLSHQISQLEKSLDLVLINRTTKKFELTEAGKIFLKYAREILNSYNSCLNELSYYKSNKIEDIIISASTIPGSHILPKFLADFKSKNEFINFKILVNNSQKSIENLIKGLVDFAAVGSFMNFKKDTFEFFELGQEKFHFICSPTHELIKSGKESVSFNELIKYPFIWREKGSGIRNTFQEQFPAYEKLKIELEINDNDSIISTVSDSNYLSVMSDIMAKKAEKAGLIKVLKVKEYPIVARRKLFFLRLKEQELSFLKNKFWNYLREELRNKNKN
ncbi:MAG: LysR substrate-binding domain-containing protein [Promethearchaeota archaeon]